MENQLTAQFVNNMWQLLNVTRFGKTSMCMTESLTFLKQNHMNTLSNFTITGLSGLPLFAAFYELSEALIVACDHSLLVLLVL